MTVLKCNFTSAILQVQFYKCNFTSAILQVQFYECTFTSFAPSTKELALVTALVKIVLPIKMGNPDLNYIYVLYM
jgi:hypothetical protein